jgi:phosphate uptake regulator
MTRSISSTWRSSRSRSISKDPLASASRPYRHVLIARSLERIGDKAVDIAEQAAFLQTRQLREFTDDA